MTLVCSGIGTSRSLAIGEAHLLQHGGIEVPPRYIPRSQVSDEVARFGKALEHARAQLQQVRTRIPGSARRDIAAFIDTHLLMMADEALCDVPIDLIRNRLCAAEWALQIQRDALVRIFDEMEDPYLRTRRDDVDHVVHQIQKRLLGEQETAQEDLSGKLLLAQDLTPADIIMMHHQGICGFITESGGPMSHTAILARSLSIPAVVGVRNATRILHHGEPLLLDGEQGLVVAGADERLIQQHQRRIAQQKSHRETLIRLIDEPARSIDGVTITLMANIELPEDIHNTRTLNADGVGLYRTEFLYMNRLDIPDEAEHYEAYRQVVEGLRGIPVTIRTLDLGADKQVEAGAPQSGTRNPALGLRAIRLCLHEPRLFQPQLRAILRVAQLGPVKLMIPMICTLDEIRQVREQIEIAKESLRRDGHAFNPDLPIGGMIEIPASALAADAFARELDFLSIGTNDLIQYTLAIDRVDEEVTYLYDPLHPSILRLIQLVIDAGRACNTPVSMCGEMAADPRYIPLLIGMGLRQFSMQPGSLLEAKRIIRYCHVGDLTEQVRDFMAHICETDSLARLSQLCSTSGQ